MPRYRSRPFWSWYWSLRSPTCCSVRSRGGCRGSPRTARRSAPDCVCARRKPAMVAMPDRQRLIERFERLIAFYTQNPPGREIEAIQFLADVFRGMGLQVAVDEFAPGRANVVARLDNGPGPTFAFNSHVDVVPAGGGWTSDPFK